MARTPRETTLSDRIMKNPLIDFSDAGYTSSDFSYYYDNAISSFDEFHKKYNLVLLNGNEIYENFPDGTEEKLDFYDIEHTIGLSSFGMNDTQAQDFMKEMLRSITTNTPLPTTINNFNNFIPDIERIINFYNNTRTILEPDYQFINQLLIDYKDIDNIRIQKYLFKLSNVLLDYAHDNKANLIKYNPLINGRKKEIIDDLVYFIDSLKDNKMKNILFNNENFSSLHLEEASGRDNFDEKSLVLGFFTNYLMNKFDINPDENNGLGIDIGKMIDETKDRYYSFYAEKAIKDKLDTSPRIIKNKIRDILNNNSEDNIKELNKVLNSIIDQKVLRVNINKDNINNFINILESKDLNINTMILLNNISKEIPDILNNNEQEIKPIKEEVDNLKIVKNQLEEKIKKLYYNNLSNKEYKNLIGSIIRNKDFQNVNSEKEQLEKYLSEITKKYNNKLAKYKSLVEYKEKLLIFRKNTKNIEKDIKNELINTLKDFSEGNNNKSEYLDTMLYDLLRSNYILPIKREAKERYSYPLNRSRRIPTNYLPDIGQGTYTDDLKLVTNNTTREISSIFENLRGYDPNDSDYENALKLVSEISDRYSINMADELYNKNRIPTEYVIKHFKDHSDGVGLIHLIHALMKNNGVKNLLEYKFNNQTGISFNYEKLMYKCNSMLSIDEIVDSRVRVSKTIDLHRIKGLSLSTDEESDINDKLNNVDCPYIMYLGGNSSTKTLVYLSRRNKIIGRDSNNNPIIEVYYSPLHSIRYETDGGFSTMFTTQEILGSKYMPQRRDNELERGILITTSEPSVIRKKQ